MIADGPKILINVPRKISMLKELISDFGVGSDLITHAPLADVISHGHIPIFAQPIYLPDPQ